MKKLFTLAMMLIALTVGAKEPGFVPTTGSYSVEVQLNPFNKNGISLVGNAVKGRYFFTDKHAVTLSLGLDCNGNTTHIRNFDMYDHDDFLYRLHTGGFDLDLGYEYHFRNYNRFAPFIGGSIGLARGFAGAIKQNSEDYYTDDENIAYTGLQATAFMGFDFYVYKGLYVGTEVGFGYNKKFYSDSNEEKTWHYGAESDIIESAVSAYRLGFYVIPGIRFGWTF